MLFIEQDESTPARHIRRVHCGWHILPGDADGLVELLHLLNANRGLIVKAGARARFAFERNFDRTVGVNRVLEILGVRSPVKVPDRAFATR